MANANRVEKDNKMATTKKVASIIACGEGGTLLGRNGNHALRNIHDHIVKGGAGHQPVALVPTIPCLAAALMAAAEAGPPDLVQIIGHARPGVLLLEQYWTKAYRKTDRTIYCAVDSSPHFYEALRGTVCPPTEVWLLGCDLGAKWEGPPGDDAPPASAAVLLFALGQLWGTRVWASKGTVNVGQFDEAGVYEGPLVGLEETRYFEAGVSNESGRERTGGVRILEDFWPSAAS